MPYNQERSTKAGIRILWRNSRRGGFSPLAGSSQPRPQGFFVKKWVGREKALASAGHVYSLNIPEKLIYMQPAGFVLTEVERSNKNIANCMSIFSRLCDSKA